MADISAFPEVARVDYVSQEGALERARKDMGEFSDVFEEAVLPASLDIHLKAGLRDPGRVKAVADRVRSYQFVDDIRYGEEWVEKLYQLRTVAAGTGLGLGLAFAAVSIIIIGATIRVSVLARDHAAGGCDGRVHSCSVPDRRVRQRNHRRTSRAPSHMDRLQNGR
jgi:cell division transport system permease protein